MFGKSDAEKAGKLYTSGKTVLEVSQEMGVSYGQARRLISQTGTEIRDPSSRLKGRTHRKAA